MPFWQSPAKGLTIMPDRMDADQEGLTLPPVLSIRLIAEQEAQRVIMQHLALCPFAKDDVSKRLRNIETRFATLVGIMVGSGLLGGVSGALMTKLLQ
jgi:hypothetical protein